MYDIGDKICDMHYGLPSKDYDGNKIKVINHIKIRLDNAEHLVRALLHTVGSDKHKHLDNPYRVDNKYAMIVGNEFGRHQAVWSYDDRWFGMLEFELVKDDPSNGEPPNPDPREAIQMAIRLLGGYSETARRFQISRAAVHQWAARGVPANRVRMMARLVDHQVTPEQLRPDVFTESDEAA